MKLDKGERLRQPNKEKCELAPDSVISQERLDQIAMLVDDEELELRELEVGPNPPTCCDHISTKGLHGCSLCRGWYLLCLVVFFFFLVTRFGKEI